MRCADCLVVEHVDPGVVSRAGEVSGGGRAPRSARRAALFGPATLHCGHVAEGKLSAWSVMVYFSTWSIIVLLRPLGISSQRLERQHGDAGEPPSADIGDEAQRAVV